VASAADLRYDTDALEDRVAKGLREGVSRPGYGTGWALPPNPSSVSVSEILQYVCEDTSEAKRSTQIRIGAILRRIGYRRTLVTIEGRREWRFVRPA